MYSIDKSYGLEFRDNSGHQIKIKDKILEELENDDLSSFPEGTVLSDDPIENYAYNLDFKDGSQLKIFKIPVNCQFLGSNETIKLYSYEHLKKILEPLNYKSPFYFSNLLYKNMYLDINKIEETHFHAEVSIEIKDMLDDYSEKIKTIFEKLTKIYKTNEITYEYICPKYNTYFPNFYINLSDKFNYIYSNNRKQLEEKIRLFLEKKDCNLYPVCGPHGTGKTITSLIIHKTLYRKGIKGIYLNFKFYNNSNINWDTKLEVLAYECFYIINNEDELLDLYSKFIKLNHIYDIILEIQKYIENKNNIYMIIDQYQKKYNINNILEKLKNIKIFLLSSINDYDVKENLIITYEEELQQRFLLKNKINNKKNDSKIIIKYNYLENLVDTKYYEQTKYKNMIRNKINLYEKDENKIENEIKSIYNILKKFNFIPKYFFGFINYYDSIFDLIFNEYSNIVKKLDQFISLKIIDFSVIKDLMNNNYLKEKDSEGTKTLIKERFINYLKFIPLKYISFTKNNNNEYYFYYSFSLFKTILDDFINFFNAKNTFFSSKDGGELGIAFEKIVKMELRAFNHLNIDGYFSVNTLTKMELSQNYKAINQNYFKSKQNILICQENNKGEDYDFGIFKPKSKELLLIQAKYIINNDTVEFGKSYYEKSATRAKNSFKEITKETCENVHLIFMSSFKYNYNNRLRKQKILKNKRINCIFYNVTKNYFSENFRDLIQQIECNDSNMVLPKSDKFTEQELLENSDMKDEEKFIEKEEEEEEEDEEIMMPKLSIIKNVDLEKLHSQIISHISNKIKNNKVKALGKFTKIQFYKTNNYVQLNKSEYAILFSLTKDADFDSKKQLGLLYSEEKKKYYYNLKKKKQYNKFHDLIENFPIGIYFAIGQKSNEIINNFLE